MVHIWGLHVGGSRWALAYGAQHSPRGNQAWSSCNVVLRLCCERKSFGNFCCSFLSRDIDPCAARAVPEGVVALVVLHPLGDAIWQPAYGVIRARLAVVEDAFTNETFSGRAASPRPPEKSDRERQCVSRSSALTRCRILSTSPIITGLSFLLYIPTAIIYTPIPQS